MLQASINTWKALILSPGISYVSFKILEQFLVEPYLEVNGKMHDEKQSNLYWQVRGVVETSAD